MSRIHAADLDPSIFYTYTCNVVLMRYVLKSLTGEILPSQRSASSPVSMVTRPVFYRYFYGRLISTAVPASGYANFVVKSRMIFACNMN